MITLRAALDRGIAQLLASGSPAETARRDAELLLLHTAGQTRTALLTHPDHALTDAQLAIYDAAIARRVHQEPIQYITGVQEFYGRSFAVSPAVLIPRPETEHLVEAVLALAPAPARVLDIGTGSGILAITLALELPRAELIAVDLSTAALAIAEQNAQQLGAADRVRFVESDLFGALDEEPPFDCIVSNPPYVAETEALEPQVRDYEPALALFAGTDGLAIYRRLIPQAILHLHPGGRLLLEIGHGQQDAIANLLIDAGYTSPQFLPDLQGIPRVAIGRRPKS